MSEAVLRGGDHFRYAAGTFSSGRVGTLYGQIDGEMRRDAYNSVAWPIGLPRLVTERKRRLYLYRVQDIQAECQETRCILFGMMTNLLGAL